MGETLKISTENPGNIQPQATDTGKNVFRAVVNTTADVTSNQANLAPVPTPNQEVMAIISEVENGFKGSALSRQDYREARFEQMFGHQTNFGRKKEFNKPMSETVGHEAVQPNFPRALTNNGHEILADVGVAAASLQAPDSTAETASHDAAPDNSEIPYEELEKKYQEVAIENGAIKNEFTLESILAEFGGRDAKTVNKERELVRELLEKVNKKTPTEQGDKKVSVLKSTEQAQEKDKEKSEEEVTPKVSEFQPRATMGESVAEPNNEEVGSTERVRDKGPTTEDTPQSLAELTRRSNLLMGDIKIAIDKMNANKASESRLIAEYFFAVQHINDIAQKIQQAQRAYEVNSAKLQTAFTEFVDVMQALSAIDPDKRDSKAA